MIRLFFRQAAPTLRVRGRLLRDRLRSAAMRPPRALPGEKIARLKWGTYFSPAPKVGHSMPPAHAWPRLRSAFPFLLSSVRPSSRRGPQTGSPAAYVPYCENPLYGLCGKKNQRHAGTAQSCPFPDVPNPEILQEYFFCEITREQKIVYLLSLINWYSVYK